METAVDLEFASHESVVRTARDAAFALATKLSVERLDDLRLLVSELVTNSVRHGVGGPDSWVRMTITVGDGRVRAEVRNPGPAFEPPAGPRTLGESGWGIYFVEHLSDRWGIDRNGETSVWFEMDLD